MNMDDLLKSWPKPENPHEAFKGALRRIIPLTELSNTRSLQLKSLTTMQEALDSSNLACACARWGAFNEATEAQCKLLAEQGWRKVPSEDVVAVKLARLIKPEEIDYVRPLANELCRWLLEAK